MTDLEFKFIISSRTNDIVTLKRYIKQGVNVNTKDNVGDTALIWSSRYGHLEIVDYLIPLVYECDQFEKIYNNLKIEQKHILFKHFMNNTELLKQVNLLKMKNFIPDINKYKNNL